MFLTKQKDYNIEKKPDEFFKCSYVRLKDILVIYKWVYSLLTVHYHLRSVYWILQFSFIHFSFQRHVLYCFGSGFTIDNDWIDNG